MLRDYYHHNYWCFGLSRFLTLKVFVPSEANINETLLNIVFLVDITRSPLSLKDNFLLQGCAISTVVVFSEGRYKFHLLPAGGECDPQVQEEDSSPSSLTPGSFLHMQPHSPLWGSAHLSRLAICQHCFELWKI